MNKINVNLETDDKLTDIELNLIKSQIQFVCLAQSIKINKLEITQNE